jgi:O-antigen/teichoic acid export membrane protein
VPNSQREPIATPESVAADVLSGHDVSQRVVRGGAIRFVGFGVVNLLGVASSLILLRHLGVVDYGRYGTVLALIAIASGLADAGMTVVGSRELALRPPGAERDRLIALMLSLRVVLCVAFVVGAFGVGLAAGYDNEMLAGIGFVGLGATLLAVQVTISLPLSVELRNARVTAIEIGKQLILVAGVALCALIGAGLVPFFAVQVAIGVGSLAIVWVLVGRHAFVLPRWRTDEIRAFARKVLPVAGALVLTVAYVRLLVILCSLLTSDYETGLFVTSARIVEMLGGVALLISGVVLPVASVAARDDRGRLEYVLARTTEVSLILGVLIALVFALAAEPVVVLLGGSEFEDAAPVLRLQAPAVVTIFVVNAWAGFLIADDHRRELLRCVLIGLGVLIAAGLVLIPIDDAQGAAIAAVVADVAYAGSLFLAIRGLPGRPTPLNRGFLLRLAGASGAAIVVGLALPGSDAVVAAVAAVVFAGACVALRMVPVDVWSAIPRPGRT